MGELVSIVYKPTDAAANVHGYTRIPVQEVQLLAGHGIEGDTKGGNPTRNLNIMAVETAQTLATEGFATAPGQMGEQLLVSGVTVDGLPPGTRLRIGKAAVIEVTEPRTGCGKFERHQGKQKEAAAGRLGVMARVVIDGTIQIGDAVTVVTA
jgi:MOSC domain-containing protein YiiM